ncbi:hypothetical protein BD779DRAFT_1558933, partial [Infundibulicybe gibba]
MLFSLAVRTLPSVCSYTPIAFWRVRKWLSNDGDTSLELTWCSGHVGRSENESVDKLAKSFSIPQ